MGAVETTDTEMRYADLYFVAVIARPGDHRIATTVSTLLGPADQSVVYVTLNMLT